MKKKLFLALLGLLIMPSLCFATFTVVSFLSIDDVTIAHLEDFRVATANSINSADGGLIQAGTITTTQLDDNANPEKRWDEAFNDFVVSGLLPADSANLISDISAGTALIKGVRVVKDATSNTYTASKWTYVDLSSTGIYTFQETASGATEPSTTTNSIRLALISCDSTEIDVVTDKRVTSVTAGASSISDSDGDTKIQTAETADEDIIRIDIGDATLSTAREVLTIQAIDANDIKVEPTTDDDVDLGAASKEFKDLYIDGTGNIDSLVADTADINGGTIDGANIGVATPGSGKFSTLEATGLLTLAAGINNADGDIFNVAWVDYSGTSTIVGWTGTPTSEIYYKKVGNLVFVKWYITGTSDATNVTFTLPYTSSNTVNGYRGLSQNVDDGANQTNFGVAVLPQNSATVTVYKDASGTSSWTNSGTKTTFGSLWYEANT